MNHFQRIVLVLSQLHHQHNLGEIRGRLEIFSDCSLAAGHETKSRSDTRPFGPHEPSYVKYASRNERSGSLVGARVQSMPKCSYISGAWNGTTFMPFVDRAGILDPVGVAHETNHAVVAGGSRLEVEARLSH